jgi:hypothetical protein
MRQPRLSGPAAGEAVYVGTAFRNAALQAPVITNLGQGYELLGKNTGDSIRDARERDSWGRFAAVAHPLDEESNGQGQQRGCRDDPMHRRQAGCEHYGGRDEGWDGDNVDRQVDPIPVEPRVPFPLPAQEVRAHDREV